MGDGTHDGIQNLIQSLSHIFAQESQCVITVFLQQDVLSRIAPVGFWI
jgi:hypothetical protein